MIQPQRSSNSAFWLCFLPLLAVSMAAWWMLRGDDGGEVVNQGFDLDHPPRADPNLPRPAPTEFVTKFEREAQERLKQSDGGSGLAGLVPEDKAMYGGEPKSADAAQRETELAFMRKYDPIIQGELKRLRGIGQKYYREYPIVKEVDRAFAKLPHYMALKRQYAKDRDFYKWSRATFNLPEFRQMVRKYSTNPEVWKVGVMASLEALKHPPPKPVYNEILRVMTSDKDVKGPVGDFAQQILPDLGNMITKSIPPGMDLGPLQNLGKDFSNRMPGMEGMDKMVQLPGGQQRRTTTPNRGKR